VPIIRVTDAILSVTDLSESLLLKLLSDLLVGGLETAGDMARGYGASDWATNIVHYAVYAPCLAAVTVPHCHWQLSDAVTIRAAMT
jgi:hypothetical protein